VSRELLDPVKRLAAETTCLAIQAPEISPVVFTAGAMNRGLTCGNTVREGGFEPGATHARHA